MLASIIIRTLDEERHLQELLEAIESQESPSLEVQVVIVDSGSKDGTLEIAREYGCRIEHIKREEFTFGRSLNLGCARSDGEILVFISGHCIPCGADWLERLASPLLEEDADYVYGRQRAGGRTRFSEARLFEKQYPEGSQIPQAGIFCNNANAAVRREVWSKFLFDEESSGLEDMQLARKLSEAGLRIGYVAEAPVYHHHDETWQQVRWRFEREALALQNIMPEIHIGRRDVARYFASAVFHDWRAALAAGRLGEVFWEVACFRWQQYAGSFRGNHEHRMLSNERKEHYFYPKRVSR